MRNLKSSSLLLAVFTGFLLTIVSSSCNAVEETDENALSKEVVTGYAAIVLATYNDALSTAIALDSAVAQFLTNPTESNLLKAKTAWITARKFYGQTEVFRFYDGPIDNGENGVEGLLNAWPLDEVYVDYVVGATNSGIINNIATYPEITKSLLVDLNESGGEENISCGYHAVEFMLWGQDLSEASAGTRPASDFIAGNIFNDRRRTYLELTTALIIEHLQKLCDQWNPEIKNNYYATFTELNPADAIQKILSGMGVLSKVELAGERMFTAYDNASQEDEQSCFSDNTKADLMNNMGGIINVFYGTYVRYDKTNIQVKAIDDLLSIKDVTLLKQTDELIKSCNNDFQNIHHPFDIAITHEDKRPQVMKAILSVQLLGDQMALIANALGTSINVSAN
jgi:putative iron-regulated protein